MRIQEGKPKNCIKICLEHKNYCRLQHKHLDVEYFGRLEAQDVFFLSQLWKNVFPVRTFRRCWTFETTCASVWAEPSAVSWQQLLQKPDNRTSSGNRSVFPQVETNQYGADDTALNGIRLFCAKDGNRNFLYYVESHTGQWAAPSWLSSFGLHSVKMLKQTTTLKTAVCSWQLNMNLNRIFLNNLFSQVTIKSDTVFAGV